jgi:hypothetical protein
MTNFNLGIIEKPEFSSDLLSVAEARTLLWPDMDSPNSFMNP